MAARKSWPKRTLKARLRVIGSGGNRGTRRLSSCRKNVLIGDIERIQQSIRSCVESVTPNAMRLNMSLDGLAKRTRHRALGELARGILSGNLEPDTETLTALAKNGNCFTVIEVKRLLSGLRWFVVLRERLGELISEWIALHHVAGEPHVVIPSEFRCSVTPKRLFRETVRALLDNDVRGIPGALEDDTDEDNDHPSEWFPDDSEENGGNVDEGSESED